MHATLRITQDAIELSLPIPGSALSIGHGFIAEPAPGNGAPLPEFSPKPRGVDFGDMTQAEADYVNGVGPLPRFSARNDGASQYDRTTGLEWSTATTAEEVNFEEAAKRAAAVRIGGHDDWRLPTIQELLSLVDYSRHNPAIDVAAFPDTNSSYYWSSSPAALSPAGCAWLVSFGYGYSGCYVRGYECCVRAVRSAAAPVQ